jgi:hypothetical protein
VYHTAKALRLSYESLKQHLPPGATLPVKRKKRSAKFVELLPLSSAVSECSVELENARGAKMKIQLKGTARGELATVAQLFWREL